MNAYTTRDFSGLGLLSLCVLLLFLTSCQQDLIEECLIVENKVFEENWRNIEKLRYFSDDPEELLLPQDGLEILYSKEYEFLVKLRDRITELESYPLDRIQKEYEALVDSRQQRHPTDAQRRATSEYPMYLYLLNDLRYDLYSTEKLHRRASLAEERAEVSIGEQRFDMYGVPDSTILAEYRKEFSDLLSALEGAEKQLKEIQADYVSRRC